MGRDECGDPFPTLEGLLCWCKKYAELPDRDAAYKFADRAVKSSWPDMAEVADAVSVFLLVWNAAFYRGDSPRVDKLERTLSDYRAALEQFRGRDIGAFQAGDEIQIRGLFDALVCALEDSKLRKSPVGAGKALHLLAPSFFPAWDGRIAAEYGCPWLTSDAAADSYLDFMEKTKRGLEQLKHDNDRSLADIEKELCGQARFPKTLLKFVDEFNYMRYTYSRRRASSGTTGPAG